jgi:hypothetical protein
VIILGLTKMRRIQNSARVSKFLQSTQNSSAKELKHGRIGLVMHVPGMVGVRDEYADVICLGNLLMRMITCKKQNMIL